MDFRGLAEMWKAPFKRRMEIYERQLTRMFFVNDAKNNIQCSSLKFTSQKGHRARSYHHSRQHFRSSRFPEKRIDSTALPSSFQRWLSLTLTMFHEQIFLICISIMRNNISRRGSDATCQSIEPIAVNLSFGVSENEKRVRKQFLEPFLQSFAIIKQIHNRRKLDTVCMCMGVSGSRRGMSSRGDSDMRWKRRTKTANNSHRMLGLSEKEKS